MINNKTEGERFAHASVGAIRDFNGKEFMREVLGTTSCEFSFGSLEAGAAVPFFHSHRLNEEIYIVLAGTGRFQVDDSVFDIAEGSAVRVSSGADRCLRNTGDTRMVYICIQAAENSLTAATMDDADIRECKSLL